mmetsp:Transcript_17859/g.31576  ORF Transcript_17859/g.31576 Transcript_17859/m.31576 type:complete len:1046 (+) Transcript_17859:47-3184(+)
MKSLNSVLQEAQGIEESDLEKSLYEAIIHGTKASNSLPGEDDGLAYYESLPEFQARIANFRERIVQLILNLASNVDSSDDLFNLSYLRDADPSELSTFEPITNIIELLLENVDGSLNEAAGTGASSFKNAGQQQLETAVSKSELVRDVRAGLHGVVTHANIDRPQAKFAVPVDNTRNPFKPSIVHKPNAIVPLPPGGLSLVEQSGEVNPETEAHARSIGMDIEKALQPRYPHPYEVEIKESLNNLPTELTEKGSLFEKPAPLSEVPCHWVDTKEKLSKMCDELKGELAIAVDLENHSYRSFQGFVCLMQVSSSKTDYLVDTLAVREHMSMMNEHFTNPAMIKVLHGSDSDVLWLQRDFGVYLVGLFDTGQAARVLEYQSFGLAHALKRHVNVRANKAFQLADWRVRPLSEDMFKYAREDTHYLLYIFDTMRQELLQAGGEDAVFNVLKRSAEIALSVYEKELYTSNSAAAFVKRKNLQLSPPQMAILGAVYSWRDAIARREDESTQYVLPDRMLVRIALDMPLVASELEHSCNPLPPVVQTRVTELLAVIRSAHDSPMEDDNDEDAEVRVLTSPRSSKQASSSKPGVGTAQPISISTPGSVHIGLNASKSSFVPIGSSLASNASTKKSQVSFAEAARAGSKGSGRKGAIMRDEMKARATPSPVLTTEQLYDTAGWQFVSDPDWKATAVAQATANVGGTLSQPATLPKTRQANAPSNYMTALATKTQIGQEQLSNSGGSFGALAKPSSAVNASLSMDDSAGVDHPGSGVEGNGDIDMPADADALESDDIPRSMAEIYRISNRNRKRNKEKKKQKDENGSGATQTKTQSDSLGEVSGDEANSSRKRSKEEENTEDAGGNGDDAIRFMRDIGWVEGGNKPIATLLVDGAPVEPQHLAGASTESQAGSAGHGHSHGHSQQGSKAGTSNAGSSKGGAGAKGRSARKTQSSPKRKGSTGSSPSSSRGKQQTQKHFDYTAAAETSGVSSKASGAGFSYSDAAAAAAGVRAPVAARGNNQDRQKKPAQNNQSQQNSAPQYRKGNSNVGSLSYR